MLRRLRAALRGDAGAVAAEVVIAVPVLLLLLMSIVQFALWSHASHIAQAAASEGLAATRVEGGTTVAGGSATRSVLDQLGAGPLRDTVVAVDRDAVTARVRVTGAATPVIPFLTLPVTAEASGSVEVLR